MWEIAYRSFFLHLILLQNLDMSLRQNYCIDQTADLYRIRRKNIFKTRRNRSSQCMDIMIGIYIIEVKLPPTDLVNNELYYTHFPIHVFRKCIFLVTALFLNNGPSLWQTSSAVPLKSVRPKLTIYKIYRLYKWDRHCDKYEKIPVVLFYSSRNAGATILVWWLKYS